MLCSLLAFLTGVALTVVVLGLWPVPRLPVPSPDVRVPSVATQVWQTVDISVLADARRTLVEQAAQRIPTP